jgi:hypothetical protein
VLGPAVEAGEMNLERKVMMRLYPKIKYQSASRLLARVN